MTTKFNIPQRALLTVLFLLSAFATWAQAPMQFNYQGIARDMQGNPLANKQLNIRFSVLPASDATVADYEETQLVKTNEFGLYTTQIGKGNPIKGEMKLVKWETGNTYIKVAIDMNGGSSFVDIGTSQLLSVPYALYADKAGIARSTAQSNTGNDRTPGVKWDEGGNIVTGGPAFLGTAAGSTDPNLNIIMNGNAAGIIDVNNNAAFGEAAMPSNTGSANSSVGYGSMNGNTTGSENTAIGGKALDQNTTGNYNTAVGVKALDVNGTGNENTAIGWYADVLSPSLTNATAIGANAKVGANNSLVLGNNANVGIGTSTPNEKLEVIGKSKTDDLQVVNGAVPGFVLTSDAVGNATWQPAPGGGGAAWLLSGNNLTGGEVLGSLTGGQVNFVYNGTPAGFLGDNNNTAFGEASMATGTAGVNGNTAMGYGAMNGNTGSENSAYGLKALVNNGANRNNAFGLAALNQNVSGAENVAVGTQSMLQNDGSLNVAVGNDAFMNNQTGSANTIVGYSAGLVNITGDKNTLLGYLTDMTSPNLNNATAIGAGAQVCADNSLILGNGANVGIGTCSPTEKLEVIGKTKTDDLQVVNGAVPGFVLTSDAVGNATWQPAAGGGAGWLLTGNVLAGGEVFGSLAGGAAQVNFVYGGQPAGFLGDNNNTALGEQTMVAGTASCGGNTAMGYGALNGNSTGNENTAIGLKALASNNANRNTALGYAALNSNSAGEDNVGLGHGSLQSADGTYNTAAGSASLAANTSGSGNVAVGYNAGSVNTTGDKNTIIGYAANVGASNLNNASAIGAGAIVNQNNSLVLGGSNVNVGINTSTPNSRLQVKGSVSTQITKVTGSTVLNDQHYTLISNHGAGVVVHTLPVAVEGRIYTIKRMNNTATGNMTINVPGGSGVGVQNFGGNTFAGAIVMTANQTCIVYQFDPNPAPGFPNGVWHRIGGY